MKNNDSSLENKGKNSKALKILVLTSLVLMVYFIKENISIKNLELSSLKTNIKTQEQELIRLRERTDMLELGMARLKSHPSNFSSNREVDSENKRPVEDRVLEQLSFSTNGSELDDPILGDKGSPIVMLVFSDFSSKIFRGFYFDALKKLIKGPVARGMLKIIIRDYPLANSPNSIILSEIASCSGEQGKYFEALDLIFQSDEAKNVANLKQEVRDKLKLEKDKFNFCLSSNRYQKEILADSEDAKRLKIVGIPGVIIGKLDKNSTTYMGYSVRGAQPFETFNKLANAIFLDTKVSIKSD